MADPLNFDELYALQKMSGGQNTITDENKSRIAQLAIQDQIRRERALADFQARKKDAEEMRKLTGEIRPKLGPDGTPTGEYEEVSPLEREGRLVKTKSNLFGDETFLLDKQGKVIGRAGAPTAPIPGVDREAMKSELGRLQRGEENMAGVMTDSERGKFSDWLRNRMVSSLDEQYNKTGERAALEAAALASKEAEQTAKPPQQVGSPNEIARAKEAGMSVEQLRAMEERVSKDPLYGKSLTGSLNPILAEPDRTPLSLFEAPQFTYRSPVEELKAQQQAQMAAMSSGNELLTGADGMLQPKPLTPEQQAQKDAQDKELASFFANEAFKEQAQREGQPSVFGGIAPMRGVVSTAGPVFSAEEAARIQESSLASRQEAARAEAAKAERDAAVADRARILARDETARQQSLASALGEPPPLTQDELALALGTAASQATPAVPPDSAFEDKFGISPKGASVTPKTRKAIEESGRSIIQAAINEGLKQQESKKKAEAEKARVESLQPKSLGEMATSSLQAGEQAESKRNIQALERQATQKAEQLKTQFEKMRTQKVPVEQLYEAADKYAEAKAESVLLRNDKEEIKRIEAKDDFYPSGIFPATGKFLEAARLKTLDLSRNIGNPTYRFLFGGAPSQASIENPIYNLKQRYLRELGF